MVLWRVVMGTWDGSEWEMFCLITYHGVLEFKGCFAGHYVAEGGDRADLNGEGDALGLGVRLELRGGGTGRMSWCCTYVAFWKVA